MNSLPLATQCTLFYPLIATCYPIHSVLSIHCNLLPNSLCSINSLQLAAQFTMFYQFIATCYPIHSVLSILWFHRGLNLIHTSFNLHAHQLSLVSDSFRLSIFNTFLMSGN